MTGTEITGSRWVLMDADFSDAGVERTSAHCMAKRKVMARNVVIERRLS